jgi:DNA repair protein RecN (Recombination protein N)
MLLQLSINNYAIIESATLQMGPSFNVIIGETGAGKSIIMGALGLILGKRADTNVLFDEEKKCVVEARLDIKAYQLKDYFEANDLDYDDTTIIRREINPKGKSRAFINDLPVTLDILRELTVQLIDIHGQQETRDIEDNSFFIKVLDKLSGQKTLLDEYRSNWLEYRLLSKQIQQFKEEAAAFSKEYDFVKYQFEELNAVTLSEEHWKTMNEEISVLQNAETIRQNLNAAADLLSQGQINVDDLLSEAQRLLGQIAGFHTDLGNMHEQVAELQISLRELNRQVASSLNATESDEGRLTELLEEHGLISRLMHKHQTSDLQDLIQLHLQLSERLQAFSFSEDKLKDMEAAAEQKLLLVIQLGAQLSQYRKEAAKPFTEAVGSLIKEMGMPFAEIALDFTQRAAPGSDGTDDITLLFAPNKGSKLHTLENVGSGGEKSRLMLAIKSVIAQQMALPTLIFDEIDTGISGEVALKVGQILRQLGQRHQILSITHLPQIAAGAHLHFFVFKDHLKAKSTTNISTLSPEESIREIAKMLSGATPDQAALDNAKALVARYN